MPTPIPHRNLPLLLLRAREDVIGRFRPILNAHGVTEQQWRILRALAESEPHALEPRQICDICTLSSPSLAGVLARMDELGLVERRRVDSDQRRVLVSLTAKSRALVRRMAPLVEREYQALEAAVGRDLVREAYDVLDRLSGSCAPDRRAESPTRYPARLSPCPQEIDCVSGERRRAVHREAAMRVASPTSGPIGDRRRAWPQTANGAPSNNGLTARKTKLVTVASGRSRRNRVEQQVAMSGPCTTSPG